MALGLLLGSAPMMHVEAQGKLDLKKVTSLCKKLDTAEDAVDLIVTVVGALPNVIKKKKKVKPIIAQIGKLDNVMDTARGLCEAMEFLGAD